MHLVAYTDAETFGGAERSLGTLLAHVDPSVQVTVVGTSRRIADAVAAERQGTSVRVVPPVRTRWDLAGIARHLSAFRALRPDVVHVNLRTPYACVCGLVVAILTPGARTVAVEHLMLPGRSRLRHWLKRWTSSRLAAHIAVSERTARLVEDDARLPAGSVSVIHNGVPALAPTDEPKRPAAGRVIGSVGRLDRQKGFDVLIEAVARLDGVTAVVAGDGPERQALTRQAKTAGVAGRLLLPGWSENVPELLAGLDVFVLSSRFEGLPLTLLEAMERGLPIVATDVGGVVEAVTDGESAVIVPPDDPEKLAEAIGALLADRELAARLGAAAHERWRTAFDVSVMVDAYEQVYRGER